MRVMLIVLVIGLVLALGGGAVAAAPQDQTMSCTSFGFSNYCYGGGQSSTCNTIGSFTNCLNSGGYNSGYSGGYSSGYGGVQSIGSQIYVPGGQCVSILGQQVGTCGGSTGTGYGYSGYAGTGNYGGYWPSYSSYGRGYGWGSYGGSSYCSWSWLYC